MFNLIVSGDCEAWKSKMYDLDIDRCVSEKEYTSADLAERFRRLDFESIEMLKSFPCLFTYENGCGQPPRFGWFKSIKKRSNKVIFECEYIELDPWITEADLNSIQASLDIFGWELSRTHWAVKDVDLTEELLPFGVSLPIINSNRMSTINPEHQTFDVAFSFPGEARGFVEKVLHELEKRMSPNDVFYDNYYKAFLARPNLDVLISNVYSKAKLTVVFLSGDYQRKAWPGLEFRSIREIIFQKQHNRVMYIRMDDSPVEGVSKIDGYIDARNHTPQEIASFIFQRIQGQKTSNSKSKN